jgi:hypothetical protein
MHKFYTKKTGAGERLVKLPLACLSTSFVVVQDEGGVHHDTRGAAGTWRMVLGLGRFTVAEKLYVSAWSEQVTSTLHP